MAGSCTEEAGGPADIRPGTVSPELQFYPPGWVRQFNGQSCDARDCCAALAIDSLSEVPVEGTTLNPSCQGEIRGGIECVNFAFLTQSSTPIGCPNPLLFNPAMSGRGTSFPAGLPKSALPGARCAANSWRQPRPGPGRR
jgi:hypothetical protein